VAPEPPVLQRSIEAAGYRSTTARRSLLRLIEGRAEHFTAADLEADVRRRRLSIGRATIFRTLELLVDLRAVERLDLPGGDHAYVLCEPSHHHHLVCSSCGRSRDIEDHGLRAVVAEIARQTDFEIDEHRLELFGRCRACRARAATHERTGAAAGDVA
jgi:Fur family ferric uptake transcriptional regulator